MPDSISPLPEGLKYLQPFREIFVSKETEDPDYPDHEAVEGVVVELLGERLPSVLGDEAMAVVESDLAKLNSWLAKPENQNDGLELARDCLTWRGHEILRLVDEWRKEVVLRLVRKVHIDLPADSKMMVGQSMYDSNLTVVWRDIETHICVLDLRRFKRLSEFYQKGGPAQSATRVSYGPASGLNIVDGVKSDTGEFKGIKYLLRVPGGHLLSTTGCFGDENHLGKLPAMESFLETAFETVMVS